MFEESALRTELRRAAEMSAVKWLAGYDSLIVASVVDGQCSVL
jgi:hypothetical protein